PGGFTLVDLVEALRRRPRLAGGVDVHRDRRAVVRLEPAGRRAHVDKGLLLLRDVGADHGRRLHRRRLRRGRRAATDGADRAPEVVEPVRVFGRRRGAALERGEDAHAAAVDSNGYLVAGEGIDHDGELALVEL